MKHSILSKSAVVAAALTIASCGQEGREGQDASHGLSFVKPDVRWSSLTVPVCWEGSASSFPTERQWVRSAVEEQYHGKTRLRFSGWGSCASGASGIRIGVSDRSGSNNPHTQGLGKQINGRQNGMMLNFTFNTWSQTCQSKRQKCITSIAVHEFGHAIGLAHEQNRPDTPESCSSRAQGSSDAVRVGSWDLNSLMNYCNPVYNNNGQFSRGDLAGISYLYGSRQAVECRAGYKAVRGSLCQSKTDPSKSEAYFELAWWPVVGDTSGPQVALKGRQGSAPVDTMYFTSTVDAGTDLGSPTPAAPATGDAVSCRSGYSAQSAKVCGRAGLSEVSYSGAWWSLVRYADAGKTRADLKHASTGLALRAIPVASFAAVR